MFYLKQIVDCKLFAEFVEKPFKAPKVIFKSLKLLG